MTETVHATATRGWQIDERARAAVIAAYDLEALRDSLALTEITDFAAALCGAPVSLVSLIEETRQVFLSHTGTDVGETPREVSFCQHAMLERDIMVVPDTTLDPRFVDNPFVTGDLHVRFYAGAPLINADGVPLGALCVLDTETRPEGLTALQRQGMRTLAGAVMERLRDSRDAAAWRHAENDVRRKLGDSEQRFRTLADAMPQMVWSALPDGYIDYWNARWYAFTGVAEGVTDGEAWDRVLHPDDRAATWAAWRQSLTTGAPYEVQYRACRADGEYRWLLARALPLRDAEAGGEAGAITRWFGTCTDVHEHKLASEEREVISQELSHRIKNIFSVISGLIAFAARGRPEFAGLATDLRERITALGRAHDFVRPHSSRSRPAERQDSLKGLLAALFEPYHRRSGGVRVEGADIAIDDRSATPLALLFHELATNASKYGALSVDGGEVVLTLSAADGQATLVWRERGGPSVSEPATQLGFGSQLVEMSAVRQLGGEVRREWRPEGLVITLAVPTVSFHRA
ncbi:sensor histidine kinase [Sphingomonas bacterium]|uniref:sensor histidine kinase n=1 Tax=Sphingomonas bacterium TaxID=1895847 RepID=UPI001575F832|nr:PAS domain-containing protein [Sphingomonas bacterium]